MREALKFIYFMRLQMIGKQFSRRNLIMRQRLIAFSYLITICFATQAHEQSPISFCDVIEFKNQSSVENFALPEVNRKQCKNWKSRSGVPFAVPIEFQHIKIDTDEELVFDRRKNNMPNFLPSFVFFDKKNNRYSFDWKKFEDAYNEWPTYQRNAEIMHADGHSRKTKVNFITRKTGAIILSPAKFFM